jgi:hypothetical protein
LLYQLSYSGVRRAYSLALLSDLPTILCSFVEHPKDIGDRSTLVAMVGLKAAGYSLLIPFGENTRYDLVVDGGDSMWRVQCKTGRLRNGGITFAVTSCYGHLRNPTTARRTYHGEVDYFAVYCPETAGVYLVPIGDLPTSTSARLRVEPPRNRQRKRIRYARDYQIATIPISS